MDDGEPTLFNYPERKKLTQLEKEIDILSAFVGKLTLRMNNIENDLKKERLRKQHGM